MVFLGAVGGVFLIGAPPIPGPLTPAAPPPAPSLTALFPADPLVQPYAVGCLRIVSLGFVFYAYGMVLTSAFNGAGDTWTPTYINLFVFWLWEIPLAWILATRA